MGGCISIEDGPPTPLTGPARPTGAPRSERRADNRNVKCAGGNFVRDGNQQVRILSAHLP
jgi:hypothetical protein